MAQPRSMSPPKEMLRTQVFWLMFVMMTMMSTGGLMMMSQFAAFSRDFGVAPGRWCSGWRRCLWR